jgi:hypothetical protein
MRLINFAVLINLLLAIPMPVSADSGEAPRWLLTLKGGQGEMQTENWDTTYSENTGFFGIEVGWKYSRQLGINLGASYSNSLGKAMTVTGRVSSDDVRTRLVPVDISAVYRLAFTKDQVVVPYVAAGYTQTFYRTDLNDDERMGDQNGYHVKVGSQLLLDSFEPQRADQMADKYGVKNTYLFVEYYLSEVDDFGSASNDLGSKGVVGGMVLEF